MSLLIILPSEHAILAKRRAIDGEQNQPIMHAIDSDVFAYLCSKTDWASGEIGVQSKVSYARTALALSEDIPRKPKRTLRVVKRKDVYNSVQRLLKAGLLRSASVSDVDKNALILQRVFWQQLLQQHSSTKNTDSQQLAGLLTELVKHKCINNSNLNTDKKSTTTGRYPPDGIYNNTINITNAASHKFQMSLTWQYDEDLVELFLQAAGFSNKQIKQVWFGKYVQYWSGETIQRTQREWSLHFANHMQGYLLRPDFFEKVNGILEDNHPPAGKNRRDKACLVSTTTGITVPRLNDGTQLQTWALANGLPVAPVGMSTTQYYQLLCNAVEKQRIMQARSR